MQPKAIKPSDFRNMYQSNKTNLPDPTLETSFEGTIPYLFPYIQHNSSPLVTLIFLFFSPPWKRKEKKRKIAPAPTSHGLSQSHEAHSVRCLLHQKSTLVQHCIN